MKMKNDNNKIKLKLSIIILFWMILIIASPIYMEKLIKNPSICSYKGFPREKVIILKMDDVEINWKNAVINLTETVLSKNMSVTLGVVPTQIDDELKKYLIDKTKDFSRIEIAQHVTYHKKNEFKYLSKSETYDIIKFGNEKIKNTLGIKAITFIPNYNINQNANILSELGFKMVSTGKNEYRYDGNLLIVGTTKQTRNSTDIIDSCKILLEQKNICVVNIHPQDYINKSTNTLDNSRYNKFVKLLDQLKMLNTKFVTFKYLLRC